MAEIQRRDQLLRLGTDEEQSTLSSPRGAALSSVSSYDTRDRSSQGSRSNRRNMRGIDSGLPSQSYLYRDEYRSSSSLVPSVSTVQSGALLLEMSLDQGHDPEDCVLSGPVVTVGHERTHSTASAPIGGGAFRGSAGSASFTSNPLSSSTTVSKQQPIAVSQGEGPAPGAYNVRGRAIGSLPAWVRNRSQTLFSRRGSERSIGTQSRAESRSSRNAPPESPVHSNSVPPEPRQSPVEPAPSFQPDNEESAPTLQPASAGSQKGGVRNMWWVVFVALVLSGIGVGVSMALRSSSQRKIAANATIATSLPPSTAPVTPEPSPSPTACNNDYNILSGAHRICVCTGSFKDWGDNFQEVTTTADEVLKVDPTLKGVLDLLKYDGNGGFTCFPNDVALLWLAEDVNQNKSPKESWVQRFLLASLFLSWTEADPFRWRISTNWLSPDTECSWSGVYCNESGQIEMIRLSRNDLSTSAGFPKELCLLTSLTSLDISFNSLSIESIPSDIAKLTNLKTLNLRSNEVKGIVPYETFPTSLVELRLEGTHMSSEIPATIKNLVNLEILEINNADITGTLPSELGELKMLKELLLGGNLDLQGGIPSEIGRLSALETLDLQYNHGMEVTFITEIGLLTSLVELNLNGVIGTGSIPSEIGLLANLTTLVLKGEVDVSPDSFSSNRGFSGSIPREIGKLSQLVILSMGGEQLIRTDTHRSWPAYSHERV